MTMKWASVDHHELTIREIPKVMIIDGKRRLRGRCHQRGHDRKKKPMATHAGCANGMAMTSGCEWHMRQWLRDTLKRRRGR